MQIEIASGFWVQQNESRPKAAHASAAPQLELFASASRRYGQLLVANAAKKAPTQLDY